MKIADKVNATKTHHSPPSGVSFFPHENHKIQKKRKVGIVWNPYHLPIISDIEILFLFLEMITEMIATTETGAKMKNPFRLNKKES